MGASPFTRRFMLASTCACLLAPRAAEAQGEAGAGCLAASITAEAAPRTPPPPGLAGVAQERGLAVVAAMGEALTVEYAFVGRRGSLFALPSCNADHAHVVEIDAEILAALNQRDVRSVDFVLAHEIAHFHQYRAQPQINADLCARRRFEVRVLELLADFAGGFAVQRLHGANAARFSLMSTIASLADYEFGNIAHHGTVTQRNSAYAMGRHAALFGRRLDMARLIRNSATFERLLFNPPPARPTTGGDATAYFRELIEELYR